MMLMRDAWSVTGSHENRIRMATSAATMARDWQHRSAISHTGGRITTPGIQPIGLLCVLLLILIASTMNLAFAAEDDLDITMTVISDPDTLDISNARELQLPATLTIKKRAVAAGGEGDPMAVGERKLLFDRPELPGLGRGTAGAVSISAQPDNLDDSRLPGLTGESDLATVPEAPQGGQESPQVPQTPNRE